ncbi:superinfection immunity protein [Hymenobacter sp. 15J16-1T3B]|uniref:superinfection immunity protein n=1 Tax=Hymenobacter sp. 15J16-1T3B TaxID=2886941 RepID=UPI001D11C3F2|nr:superinfection immunity protein [Hymenobacter sp. 15J16-1T3B]MCC3156471.1 superinfection immunity protein [Hymenobacter sp. 15J16-1T3B]
MVLLSLLLQVSTDTSDTDYNPIAGFLALMFAGLLYFIPAIVGRTHRQATSIFFLNLLLGWSIIGWIGALIWALSKPAPSVRVVAAPGPRSSVADELQKLQALREAGTITAVEFEQQKARLLS